MSKTKEPIYFLHPTLRWKTFKTLQDRLVRDEGPSPVGMDKVLWQMMRDKQILCWFDPLVEGDMKIGKELPKNRKVLVVRSPEKATAALSPQPQLKQAEGTPAKRGENTSE